MRKGVILALALVAVLAMAGLGAAAQARGVTDTTIKIGQWGPQTGPAALWGSVARGTGVYFEMLNAEGGINGRKIEYFLRDDGYQPNRTKAVVKELMENVGVFGFASGVGTSPGMAVMSDLVANDVPWVGAATGSTHWAFPPKKTVFAVYPNYPDEAAILTNYILFTLKKEKIAFIYQNDDYGKGGLEGAQAEMKARGKKLVAEVPVEVTDTDLASHVMKLKQAGADAVIMWVLPKHAAILLGTSAKLGFKPEWVACSTLSDAPLMHKITKGLWKGVIFGNFAELPDSSAPLMVKYKAAFDKYADKKSDHWGVFFYAGFGFVEPMVEGIKRAGKDLTVDSFVKAMETLKEFKGIMGRVTFAPGERQGMREVFLARCDEAEVTTPDGKKDKMGKAVRLSDWIQVQ
jgi:ABC-type branched-subunit amino acid transport system substrate-binding protein